MNNTRTYFFVPTFHFIERSCVNDELQHSEILECSGTLECEGCLNNTVRYHQSFIDCSGEPHNEYVFASHRWVCQNWLNYRDKINHRGDSFDKAQASHKCNTFDNTFDKAQASHKCNIFLLNSRKCYHCNVKTNDYEDYEDYEQCDRLKNEELAIKKTYSVVVNSAYKLADSHGSDVMRQVAANLETHATQHIAYISKKRAIDAEQTTNICAKIIKLDSVGEQFAPYVN
jgi:hypothetical protein